MIRREFLGLLSAAAAWSAAAKADQRIPLIGILDPDVAWTFDAFIEGMRALGYEEGRNIRYEWRSLHGKPETVGALAAELVALKPDVLVTVADSFVRILQQATSTIPIVFLIAGSPVASGIVESLAHPGRRTTGLSFDDDALSTKRLDLLRQLVPGLHEVGILYAARAGKNLAYETTERTARAFGLVYRKPGSAQFRVPRGFGCACSGDRRPGRAHLQRQCEPDHAGATRRDAPAAGYL